eukprot:6459711-Amphidinium_carterae.1
MRRPIADVKAWADAQADVASHLVNDVDSLKDVAQTSFVQAPGHQSAPIRARALPNGTSSCDAFLLVQVIERLLP